MASGTIKTEWEDISSSFTPASGVTDFEAFFNNKLNVVWVSGKSPSSYTTGNSLVTIPSAYAGESRNQVIHELIPGDGNIHRIVVNGTNLTTVASSISTFGTSFYFYGFYRIL